MATEWKDSKEYYITYGILINAARHFGVATYQEIAQSCGFPTGGNYMSSVVGNILGAISKNEIEHGRPFLSAIAVGVSGKPGEGFYNWAKDLGAMKPDQAEEDFLTEEVKKIYDLWKPSYRISKTKG